MTNIFEGAKFGDKFKTRDGKIAIYVTSEDDRYGFIVDGFCETMPYILEDEICKIARYNINGNPYSRTQYTPSMDIVDRWEENIPFTYSAMDNQARIKYPEDVWSRCAFKWGALWAVEKICDKDRAAIISEMGIPTVTMD